MILKTFYFGARGAFNSRRQLPRRAHGEADGPMKPSRRIWTRIWSYFAQMLTPKSKKKTAIRHGTPIPEARGKRQEARGKGQEARRKRQEARGKTPKARGKTPKARGKKQEARGKRH